MVITFNDISFVFQKLHTFFSTVSFVVHLSAVGRNRHTSNVRNPTRNHSNKPLKKQENLLTHPLNLKDLRIASAAE